MALATIASRDPLLTAAMSGDVEKVKELLQQEWNVGCKDPETGKTPLHYACEKGHVAVARELIESKASLSIVDDHGFYPLHYACEAGHLNLVRVLVSEFKVDMTVSKGGRTAIMTAARGGHDNLVLALLDDYNCPITGKDGSDWTVLHHACAGGSVNIVQALLLRPGAKVYLCQDIRLQYDYYTFYGPLRGCTPLHVAANVDVLRCLIDKFGCCPNKVGGGGYTVLHCACERGALDIVRVLVNHYKVNVNVCDEIGDMPLHVAAQADQYDIVLALISEFGCDPRIVGYFGYSLLHYASEIGWVDLVCILIDNYKVDMNVCNDHGSTPLHLAAREDRIDCVKHLVHANAALLVRDNWGETPADVATGKSQVFLNKSKAIIHPQFKLYYKEVLKHAEKKHSGSHHITRVFVLGYPGAGKSSFIESLKRENAFKLFRRVSLSSVPPHTAGIIPSIHMSKDYGRVLFYDFAGDVEYYSSHAAIFESLASSRKGDNIFIVVVDLRENSSSIETTLHYWLSFIQYQNFNNPSLIVIGSHADLSKKCKEKRKLFDKFCSAFYSNIHRAEHFMLDCRDPRSFQIAQFKKQIVDWVSGSQKYEISKEASLLLGLLEKDFSAVTACPVKTLESHLEECGVWLSITPEALHGIIMELHEVGVLLLLGDYTKDFYQVILNISKLTNKVHDLLFSESAISSIQKTHASLESALNIGIVPEAILAEILPPYITKECLIHLQYCQQINHSDVGFFPILEQSDSSSQSFLFFPALCSVDKSQVSWEESMGDTFSMGWLALCTDSCDYFPPRFLHVLLLRIIYSFTHSVPTQLQTTDISLEHGRRCTMWKKGVYWSMEDGVDCMVELVEGSKGVVVLSKSSPTVSEDCIEIFTKVVSCVMEAKAEFCHSIRPQFFLLDSTGEADYLNKDHQFHVSDVERALARGKPVAISMGRGMRKLDLSKLQCMRKFTHWLSLFPIEYRDVLRTLRVVVNKLHDLGLCLGASSEFLDTIQVNFPSDVDQRRRELVRWWMSCSQGPPCWWKLAEALKDIEMGTLAEEIQRDHCQQIQLQEKMLGEKTQALKPDEEFLHSLSGVVGSRWPSLAVFLLLNEVEIKKLKEQVGFSQQELALQMLKIWASKEEATYCELCQKLNTISLFQYSTS